MFTRISQNESGVSLLEVLVAMILISVGLMMLLNLSMIALGANDWSNNATTSVQALQQKIEQLRGTNIAFSQSGTDTVQEMVRSWRVTNAGDHLRRIEVEVVWNDLQSVERTDRLSTLVRTDSL